MANFRIVEPSVWQLSDRVKASRRSRLLTTPFDAIVQQLVSQARWTDCCKQLVFSFSDHDRVELRFKFVPKLVDLFHNGAGGYRAQYYFSEELGKSANRYVLDEFLRKLKISDMPRKSKECEWDFVQTSLRDPDAKIWIHEGAWYEDDRIETQNLTVPRWQANAPKIKLNKKNFEPWHPRMTPKDEPLLEIKGGALNEKMVGGVELKPSRSEDLYEFGYT